MKIFIHGTPLPQKYLKKQNLIKNYFEDFSKPFLLVKDTFKKTIKEKYEEKILEKISSLSDSSKLFLYRKLKTDIKLEDYLKLTKTLTIDSFQ